MKKILIILTMLLLWPNISEAFRIEFGSKKVILQTRYYRKYSKKYTIGNRHLKYHVDTGGAYWLSTLDHDMGFYYHNCGPNSVCPFYHNKELPPIKRPPPIKLKCPFSYYFIFPYPKSIFNTNYDLYGNTE